MPGTTPEKSGTMEKEHSQHSQDPQPIDVVSSFFHDFSSTHLAECKSLRRTPFPVHTHSIDYQLEIYTFL
jgi:hypothetical protein